MKKKSKLGKFIIFIVLFSLGIGALVGWQFLVKEHNEARNLPLNKVDFAKLNDGTYIEEYEGGIYKWRTNKVQVEVVSGKVSKIKLLSSSDPGKDNIQYEELFSRVIEQQSLQVDTISGATLTSKAYLKGVENALVKAVK